MSGLIDPRTNQPVADTITIQVDQIVVPVPHTDAAKMMNNALNPNTGLMQVTPATLALWMETASRCAMLEQRIAALEAGDKPEAAPADGRSALRNLMGGDK